MLNFFYRLLNNKEGFTLIEVLVVVAIIGILAALAAPRIIGRIDDARRSSDQALAKTIETAIAQYIVDKEMDETGTVAFPASLNAFLTADLDGDGTGTETAFEKYFDASTRTLLDKYAKGDSGYKDEFQARILTIKYDSTDGTVTTSEPTT